jgi:hypothetical protein
MRYFLSLLLLNGFYHGAVQDRPAYFTLITTNISATKYAIYSKRFIDGLGWLQTGNYTAPPSCRNCADYTKDSRLQKATLDSLILQYKNSGVNRIYVSQYVPSLINSPPRDGDNQS